MKFGTILRQLRAQSGVSIKRLAPDLGVTYSYLSKLENEEVNPSEEFVSRVSRYFDFDRDKLLLSAGKVPDDIMEILQENPEAALTYLKTQFGNRHGQRSK